MIDEKTVLSIAVGVLVALVVTPFILYFERRSARKSPAPILVIEAVNQDEQQLRRLLPYLKEACAKWGFLCRNHGDLHVRVRLSMERRSNGIAYSGLVTITNQEDGLLTISIAAGDSWDFDDPSDVHPIFREVANEVAESLDRRRNDLVALVTAPRPAPSAPSAA